MGNFAIVISGLPASGKTTAGRAVAEALGIPFLDKDDFLEELFEQRGVGDADWRRALSMEADTRFRDAARTHERVVLISHWRPNGLAHTGTPTDWITSNFDAVIELYCACPPDVVRDRFISRERHAGHLDRQRSPADISKWMDDMSQGFPLGIGPLIEVSVMGHPNLAPTVDQIRSALGWKAA